MSYRSIKRVLGETSLERKCRFLFGGCLLLLITASFWWYGSQTEELVYAKNQITGRLLVKLMLVIEHWKTWEQLKEKGNVAEGTVSNQVPPYLPVIEDMTKNVSKQKFDWRFIRPDGAGGTKTPRNDDEW